MDRHLSFKFWFCFYMIIAPLLQTSLGRGLPTVDPGLFVISGVGTCGGGEGYCLLGLDCTLDEDFVPDDEEGHCDGLKSAFTPSAHFVCCKDTNKTTIPVINFKPKPGGILSTSIIPESTVIPNEDDENEIDINNVISKIAETINSSIPNNNIINNITRESQPAKLIEKETINNSEEQLTIDNKEDAIEQVLSDEEMLLTTELPTNFEVEDMTENYENKMKKGETKMKMHDVSLKSDEVYGSGEESLTGDAEWMAVPSEEHLMNHNEDKTEKNNNSENDNNNNISNPSESNENNVVPVTQEDDRFENNVKIGNVIKQQEMDQGYKKDENKNGEDVTDNIKSSEAATLNTDIHVYNQFDMTNPTTPISTIEPAIMINGDSIHKSTSQRPDKAKEPDTPLKPSTNDSNSVITNIDKPCGISARCISLVRFTYKKNPICYGNPLHNDWIVTSASCALRIFRVGMFNVSVVTDDEASWGSDGHVRTIIVHENYRAMENELHLEVNNIGLLRIYPGLGWEMCRACLPQPSQKFDGERCATHPLGGPPPSQIRLRYNDHMRSGALCEGITELVPGTGDFLSLPCPTNAWNPRAMPNSSPSTGLPLRCDGILAGVQAGEGIGTRIYTSISTYLDWIKLNTMAVPQPIQTFKRLDG
ncbi:uncharacterized protein LOC142325076 [Lycorma delicatula]|uniref:uncharacterized protein LOC142325076 n=1 Tax=Lycorma delicatula TaxID=130591 RepID=UPI003F513C83